MKRDKPALHSDPLCLADDATLSYTHIALAIYLGHAEPFFARALRRVHPQLTTADLRDQIDAFCAGCRARHRSHADYVRRTLGPGHPGLEQRVDVLRRDFERFMQRGTDRFRIGYMAGFVAHGAPVAAELLANGVYSQTETQADTGQHFAWHMAHWLQYKDMAEAVQDRLFKGYLSRLGLASQARRHLLSFVRDAAQLLSIADVGRYGAHYRLRRLSTSPWASGRWWPSLRQAMPGHSLRGLKLPEVQPALTLQALPRGPQSRTFNGPDTAADADLKAHV